MMRSFFLIVCSLTIMKGYVDKTQIHETDYLKFALQDTVVQSHIALHLDTKNAINLHVNYIDTTFALTINTENKSDSIEYVNADIKVSSITSSKSDDKKQIEIDLGLNNITIIYIKLAYKDKQLFVRKVKGNTRIGKKRKSSIYISNY